LKVAAIGFADFRSCLVGRIRFGWYFFFSCDNFISIHGIEYGLRVDSPFDVVRGVQVLEGFQAGDVVVVLFGGVGGGYHRRVCLVKGGDVGKK